MRRDYLHPSSYSTPIDTGILAATLGVGDVFAMRNLGTKTVYVHRLEFHFACTVAFTAAAKLQFRWVRFSAATHTAGTAGAVFKRRTGADASGVTDVRSSATALLGGAGVVTDTGQLSVINLASPAAGQFIGPIVNDLYRDPVRLAPNEGLLLRNQLAWPAAGTGIVGGSVGWFER